MTNNESMSSSRRAGRILSIFLSGLFLLTPSFQVFSNSSFRYTNSDSRPAQTALPDPNLEVSLVRVIDTSTWDPPSPDPVGIEYHPGLQRLLISDSEVDEMAIFQGVNLFQALTAGDLLDTCSTTFFSFEPTGLAVNPENNHLFISDDRIKEIFEVDPGDDGQLCSPDDIVTRFDTKGFGSFDPEGLAYGQGKLFVADGRGAEIFVVAPGLNGAFDGAPPVGDDLVTNFDTAVFGLSDPKGIGYHNQRGTLFVVSRRDDFLMEVTPEGDLIRSYDISFSKIIDPSGVAIGPSSRYPDTASIYVAARGIDNDFDKNENDGKVYEFVLMSRLYLPLVYQQPIDP